jgi:hypothetical protein
LGAGKVDFLYKPAGIEGEIADRGKVIEFGIFVPRQFELFLSAAEFFALHLQLDLVDLELMDKPLRLFLVAGKFHRGGSLHQLLFGKKAKFAVCDRQPLAFVAFHDEFL